MLVGPLRPFVIETEALQPRLSQRVQLVRFGDAVVVHILPQPQVAEDGVLPVDQAVAVAAPPQSFEWADGIRVISEFIKSLARGSEADEGRLSPAGLCEDQDQKPDETDAPMRAVNRLTMKCGYHIPVWGRVNGLPPSFY